MKAKVFNLEQLKDTFNKIAKADLSKGFVIEWKRFKKVRTNDQNALYWMWLTCLEQETGQEKDSLHDYFREKYLQVTYEQVFDSERKILQSTTKLDTVAMKNYLDKIQVFAATELAVTLPDPEDRYFEEFLSQYERFR
ncbi:MAG TPA: hypothetical protein VFC62_01055 [Atopostipes sp.]|jgi:hypothetical protein|nr:hypothetical protein [Atopostipes sp.]